MATKTSEYDAGGNHYRSEKLCTKDQFKAVKRLSPVIGEFLALQSGQAQGLDFVTVLVSALQKISDDDLDFIIDKCLSVSYRNEGGHWVVLYNERAKRWQYEDMDMGEVLVICRETLSLSIQGFLGGPLPLDTEEVSTSST